jgi:hypothetical protein
MCDHNVVVGPVTVKRAWIQEVMCTNDIITQAGSAPHAAQDHWSKL